MNTNQHLFKAWEAWVIRPDGRYYRYLGFEILPTGGFCVCERQLHEALAKDAQDQPSDPRTAQVFREGLDTLRNHPGVSKTYMNLYSAVINWDINHPETPAASPHPTGVSA